MIVMTIKEGEIMNKNFKLLKDSIELFKIKFDTSWRNYIKTINKLNENYAEERNGRLILKKNYDTLEKKYILNKMLYEKREKDWLAQRWIIAGITVIPYFLLMMMAK